MLVYVGAVAQRLLESYVSDVKFDLEAVIDGVPRRWDSLDVIVKNTRIFGGERVLDPDSAADDGLFELVPITGRRDMIEKLIGSFRHSALNLEDLRASSSRSPSRSPAAASSSRFAPTAASCPRRSSTARSSRRAAATTSPPPGRFAHRPPRRRVSSALPAARFWTILRPSPEEPMPDVFIYDAVRTPRGRGKAGKGGLSHIHPQELLAQP